MANTILRSSSLILVWLIGLACIPTTITGGFADDNYRSVSWQQFANAKVVNQKIDLQDPDLELLNAAVFFASNQAREQRKMPIFRFQAPLRDMARFHAKQMAKYHFVSHDNPRAPRYATVEARGRQFDAQVNAENVASTFLHKYSSGSRYYTKKTSQGDTFFDSSSRQIKVHTYWSFAQDIVQGWIDSPPHRKNLFHPQLKTLGCACEVGRGEVNSGQLPMAYCGQNFGIQ